MIKEYKLEIIEFALYCDKCNKEMEFEKLEYLIRLTAKMLGVIPIGRL